MVRGSKGASLNLNEIVAVDPARSPFWLHVKRFGMIPATTWVRPSALLLCPCGPPGAGDCPAGAMLNRRTFGIEVSTLTTSGAATSLEPLSSGGGLGGAVFCSAVEPNSSNRRMSRILNDGKYVPSIAELETFAGIAQGPWVALTTGMTSRLPGSRVTWYHGRGLALRMSMSRSIVP